MNKEQFLQQLQKYIEILDEKEQTDILDEYRQHIEMKMQKLMKRKTQRKLVVLR